ncbi:MAG TPA: response regulator [Bacteroidales bacterium]
MVFIFMAIGNFVFIYLGYKQQSNYHLQLIKKQSEAICENMEQKMLQTENEMNKLIYKYHFSILFTDKDNQLNNELKNFYSKYSSYINNLLILDSANNIYNLYRDQSGAFITDIYQSRTKNQLFKKENTEQNDGHYLLYFPIYENNKLIFNIIIDFNLFNFLSESLTPFLAGKAVWQAVFTENKKLVYTNLSIDSMQINCLDKMNIKDSVCYLMHKIDIDNKGIKYLTVVSVFTLAKNKYMLSYNFMIESFFSKFIFNAFNILLFNFIILLVVVILYLKLLRWRDVQEKTLRESEEAFKQIIELIPIGIIIIDKASKIKTINKAALKILMIDDASDILGTDISHKFLVRKALIVGEDYASAYETDHFLKYEKEGKEVIIYKRDIPLFLKGEEVIVQSYIDVTPLEKSRQREMAANMAKSEFLAKMSHEIRTPMNGIIGMADSLMREPLGVEQAEQVNIIKKSADLLLNIINDILDLSKIEAGKMVLEEIPFKLHEEIKLIAELFAPAAMEKDVLLKYTIDSDIPDKLIGDPFRLRQIIINLIGNSIKFTQEGQIWIKISKVEEYNRNLVLKFVIEDTGIGIPKEKLNHIFQSFTQVDNSTTRKYGGTGLGTSIAKQLVELMHGEISVESPSSISTNPRYPGAVFTFTVELYSDEPNTKSIDNSDITSFNQIKTLIIGENKTEEKQICDTLSLFNVPAESVVFQKSTIDILKKNFKEGPDKYKLIIIRDTPTFDGFKLVSLMNDAKLMDCFKVWMISSNDKVGNYSKSRRTGVDHYLIMPYETSELYNCLCESFEYIHIEDEKLKFKISELNPDLRILVAEDNSINQKVARTLFKNIGYEIEIAQNGLEVLERLGKYKYDIIFMDVMMPEMDGIQATQEIRRNGNHIPIIAMTANIAKEERANALKAGMDDYVTKPVRIDVVKKILIKLFSKEL